MKEKTEKDVNEKKETEFKIKFQAPLGLVSVPSSLTMPKPVRWRVSNIDIKKEKKDSPKSVFVLTLSIHQKDLNELTKLEELKKFRDIVVSLLSFIALCPIQLLSKGTFVFHLGGNKYKTTSLGPMQSSSSPTPLNNIEAVIEGLTLTEDYMAALYFMEKAIVAEEILYEFINLAICCELIIDKDSTEPSFVNPKCKNGHTIKNCPVCNCHWHIPNSLRARAKFLMEESLSKDFVIARNRVFHGDPNQINEKFLNNLEHLNRRLLICMRNYLGNKINLPPIKEADLPFVIKAKHTNPIVSIYFTHKSKMENKWYQNLRNLYSNIVRHLIKKR